MQTPTLTPPGVVPVMDLHDKVSQLLFYRIGSFMIPPRTVTEDAQVVEEMLERHAIGGLVLFNGHWPQVGRTLERLQETSRYPLLVTADLERGAGQQVAGLTLFPHAAAFAHLGPEAEAAAEAFGRATAREARAAGIHGTFAPVTDVNRNRNNPIIATRAFGNDPETVARLSRAFIRGCRAEGLLSTAKHFPGHGNTDQDSHAELLTITDTREDLERYDLPPFRAAIEAGAEMVMVAHGIFPSLDPSRTPASLSRPILHDLLRGEMGFDGVVISDSLRMGGARKVEEERVAWAVDMIAAGVDVLLDMKDAPDVIEALVQAVEEGVLPEARVDEALARVWRLKSQVMAHPAPPLTDEIRQTHHELAADVARRALWAEGTDALPIRPEENVCAIFLKSIPMPPQPLGDLLAERFPRLSFYELGPDADPATFPDLLEQAAQADRVLVTVVVRPAAWQTFGLRPQQAELVRALTQARPVVLASLGVPEVLEDFEAATRLCTYSEVPVSQQALVDALTGRA